jgi:hypothetical protein
MIILLEMIHFKNSFNNYKVQNFFNLLKKKKFFIKNKTKYLQ